MIAQLPFPPPRRAPRVRGGLMVDAFAGGGGASLGIERALGRHVDVAINHDEDAIEMHAANHPRTLHFRESVWTVDPREVCAGQPVALLWLSPDCKHFSRAKGGKPAEKKIRSLAWLAVRWAKAVRPRVIALENVPEFQTWGPLLEDDTPCPKRKGQTFRQFVGRLRGLGYEVEWRVLNAADYGAPTHRRRLFLVARCDGRAIEWPAPTHGPGRVPYRTAAEIIDWSLPCPSIFGRKRPLAEATMRRIANGMRRYVFEAARPFIVETANGERVGQEPRTRSVDRPLGTVRASGSQGALVMPFLSQFFGGMVGKDIREPVPTVTAIDHNALAAAFVTTCNHAGEAHRGFGLDSPACTIAAARDAHGLTRVELAPGDSGRAAEVRAFLLKWYGACSDGQDLYGPLHTVTAKARFGLVTIEGVDYQVVDIGLRMLTPRELARAQGFHDCYVLTGTKSNQIARIGNSVCPVMAEAIVRANVLGAREAVSA